MNISIGNCPDCGHYPAQFITDLEGEVIALHLPTSRPDYCSTANARILAQKFTAAQMLARGWKGQSYIWQDRAENAECLVARLETELARVRETLSDLYHQHKCGCGHPACRSCGRDRDVEAALSQPAEQPAAPDSDLPLMARRAGHPSDADGVMYKGAQRICFIHGELNPPEAGFVTYRIADTDEHGLPVIERTAETPEWAKYTGNHYRQFAREYQTWMQAKSGWRRIEDYNAHGREERGDE